MLEFWVPYSQKFSRGKHISMFLLNSAQKQIFTDKFFVVKLPAMHYSCYEPEISWEKFFVAILRPTKSAKIFDLKKF